MRARRSILGWLASVLLGMLVVSTPTAAQDRGQLLYATHCGACHTAQMHWRAGRTATDWPTLKAEVRRWQGVASLAWTDDDVIAVARYLNDSIYHFEQRVESRAVTRLLAEK
ncbi:MAG: cytochrome C [Burkholderiales bacterium]